MSKSKLVSKLVRFKSGRIGIIMSVQRLHNGTFFVVLVPGLGLIDIGADDVEIITK